MENPEPDPIPPENFEIVHEDFEIPDIDNSEKTHEDLEELEIDTQELRKTSSDLDFNCEKTNASEFLIIGDKP